jgi:hypothetical protein
MIIVVIKNAVGYNPGGYGWLHDRVRFANALSELVRNLFVFVEAPTALGFFGPFPKDPERKMRVVCPNV